MEMDEKRPICPKLDVDGFIEKGKQFDLDITLPEDNREVIYGIVKDCYREPVEDAVVKLVEIICECGRKERKPVTHTFTDENGEFVFGPLCPGKEYALEIFVNEVKHVKICAKCHHEGKCLKAKDCDKCDCMIDKKTCKKDYEESYEKPYDKHCEKDYDKDYEKDCDKKCEKDYDKYCEKECEKEHEKHCEKECEKECEKHCEKEHEKPCCDKDCDKDCKKHCEKPCFEKNCWDKHCCNR